MNIEQPGHFSTVLDTARESSAGILEQSLGAMNRDVAPARQPVLEF
jgi:hypothetical protein